MCRRSFLFLLGIIISANCQAAPVTGLKAMTDDEIRTDIIQGSLKHYTGECPCPYSLDTEGKKCGEESEYFRSRGKIICYKQDISIADVNAYRLKFSIIDPISVPHNAQIK